MTKSTSLITLTAVLLLVASSSSTSVLVQAVPVSIPTTSNSNSNPVVVAAVKRDETSSAAPVIPAVAPITQNADNLARLFKNVSEYFAKLAVAVARSNIVTNPSSIPGIAQSVSHDVNSLPQNTANMVGGDSITTTTTDGSAAPSTSQDGIVN